MTPRHLPGFFFFMVLAGRFSEDCFAILKNRPRKNPENRPGDPKNRPRLIYPVSFNLFQRIRFRNLSRLFAGRSLRQLPLCAEEHAENIILSRISAQKRA